MVYQWWMCLFNVFSPLSPDRFRQLEVLHQVTTAFSSLMGSFSYQLRPPPGTDKQLEVPEPTRHLSMLFRRASKKAVRQIRDMKSQGLTAHNTSTLPCTALQPLRSLEEKEASLETLNPELHGKWQSSLAERTDHQPQAQIIQKKNLSPCNLSDSFPAHIFLQMERSQENVRESSGKASEKCQQFIKGSPNG